ncbi:aldehyde dehydrogenase [Amylibacter sp.]|jgi:aldehyde dehydrogenase (NAD+)|nr:aldehyde dehydrogenase [Amylibacter sp.]MDA9926291.1 aldehyde dehydrogenase [Amylibacter sp.]MDB2337898.1 aldehyde dehydrogenase [Amylibacter sp.]MDB3878826.1 aldehyde dehydrogenase [Amylibacter sp.]MDB4100268.1 aldehyde dehydrogenase [Amylibacter sp.]|tara:strand:- start:2245 stop:3723 length:1479 start_codon:yes stop_codon:yes gene_type:complete
MKRKPHYQLYIDGSWVSGSTNQKMDAQNPANGENWATFDCASKSDVDLAVKSARRALTEKSWCNISQTQRGKLLYKLANLIEENAGIIGQIETNDSGKLLAETSTQTGYVADYYRYYAGLADKIEGSVLPIDKPDMHVFTKREPIGVVVAVVPWNAQMFLTATKLGPALAAGCTVILKASEIAPTPMLEFAKLIDQAGFPPGVVSIITGDAENCSIPLTSHPDIDRIAFTGGPDTARNVIKNSSNNFAVTSLELGGKSPIIVFEDADLESAANGLIAGNFGASGQSCVAGSRGLIHKNVLKDLINLITEKSKNIRVGSPLDPDTNVGPLCTKAQIDNISKTLKISKSQGAKIHFGGSQLEKPGNYMEPTLIECMDSNTETLKVEMFGPIMSLLSFDTEDEAIMFANDSKFGLGSGIFTQNIARAHRVSSKIKAGICWINTYRAISPIAPFGGYNQSGYGREAGIDSIYDYTRTKTIWVNTSDKPMENPFIMR